MKTTSITRIQICHFCGSSYRGVPATSRKDGKTAICPDCGTREALESIGVSKEEQDSIIQTIHQCEQRGL